MVGDWLVAVKRSRPGQLPTRPSTWAHGFANQVPGALPTLATDLLRGPAQRLRDFAALRRHAKSLSASRNRKSQGVKISLRPSSAPVLADVISGELRFSKVFEGFRVRKMRTDCLPYVGWPRSQESMRTLNHGKPCGDTGELT